MKRPASASQRTLRRGKRALFLDRDGTIIRNRPYLDTPDGIRLLPNAVRGLKAWIRAGYLPIVVTNQSGIARGLFTRRRLDQIHRRLVGLLRERGVELGGIYVCPHHPEGRVGRYRRTCGCRKPKPGLLRRAARECRIDLRESVTVGDSASDVQAGRAAGTRTILLGVDARDLLDAFGKLSAVRSPLSVVRRRRSEKG